MDAQRSGEPIGDIDRELAAALAIDPSPEFLARVRMRIAAEPEPLPSWRASWMMAGAAAMAVAAVVAIAVAQMSPPGDPKSQALPGIAAVDQPREKPTAEMRAVMGSNAQTNAGVKAHLHGRDYDALARDAATYSGNFSYIESFWTARNVAAPLELSRQGLKAAADLKAAALAKDAAAVATALAAIFSTCDACHKQYREQLADGTFAIKL
jgi:hypothetical protein